MGNFSVSRALPFHTFQTKYINIVSKNIIINFITFFSVTDMSGAGKYHQVNAPVNILPAQGGGGLTQGNLTS